MKVALVHDWLNGFGEPERILRALCAIWPEAPVFSAVYNAAAFRGEWCPREVRTGFLQRIPLARHYPENFWPLFPLMFEELDLRGFDLVVSSHHTAAHGVIVDADALHLAYVHAPSCAAWRALPSAAWRRALRAPWLNYFRAWEVSAGLRVDHFLTHAASGQSYIAKTRRRHASVLPPPIRLSDLPALGVEPRQEHVALYAPGLAPDMQRQWVHAFESAGYAMRVLENSRVENLYRELASARAVCLPGDDTAVGLEAIACGTPLLRMCSPGLDDAPFSDEVAVYLQDHAPQSIARAFDRLQEGSFDRVRLRAWAAQFDEALFAARLRALVQTLQQQFRAGVASADFSLPHLREPHITPFQESSCFNPSS